MVYMARESSIRSPQKVSTEPLQCNVRHHKDNSAMDALRCQLQAFEPMLLCTSIAWGR